MHAHALRRRSLEDSEEVMHDRLLGQKELRELVPLHPAQIARMEKAGRFPRRVQVSEARVAWSLFEIVEWIEQRKAERD